MGSISGTSTASCDRVISRLKFYLLRSWCPTHQEYFGISTQSPSKGAVLHVHNCNYVHAPPTVFSLAPKPQFVRDFAFLSLPGIPRIAAAVGRTIMIFPIGVDT